MELSLNAVMLEEFHPLAIKNQGVNDCYQDLAHEDGRFKSNQVQFAFIVYCYFRQAEEGSRMRKAFDQWRSVHYGEHKSSSILFAYIEALKSEDVNNIWEYRWDARDRNISLEREVLCRIFILYGFTVQKHFENTGILT